MTRETGYQLSAARESPLSLDHEADCRVTSGVDLGQAFELSGGDPLIQAGRNAAHNTLSTRGIGRGSGVSKAPARILDSPGRARPQTPRGAF